jgi:hypothetical protein
MPARRIALHAAILALVGGLIAVPASAVGTLDPGVAHYLVGADVESIAPTQAMLDSGAFYLGGFGLGNGKALDTVQTPLTGRAATGLLGTDGAGVHVRALAIGDGRRAIEFAQIEVQGYFASYKQGPFGIEEIRKDAAAEIAALHRPGAALSAGSILVDSNHTHSGPDTTGVFGGVPTSYLELVHDQTVRALVSAYEQMAPATLVFGVAHAGVVGEPQRYPSSDPLLTNQYSYDPHNQAVDDEIRVLQARSVATGDVIATYSNFSGHPDVLGSSNTLVSSDYTGVLSEDMAQAYGGVGFDQVATLGRTQPNRGGCPDASLSGGAASRCALDSYAGRVFQRVQAALAAAAPVAGAPVVALHSYLIQDAATNPLLAALGYSGYAVGAPIYRAMNPPWFTGDTVGTVSFSGRIGNILISGGPGEMYPQIVATVRRAVPAQGYLNIGTAGDFLGYIIAPLRAYPEPIRRSLFDGDPPPAGNICSGVHSLVGCPDPIGNDNFFFNLSVTFGARLTCSLLRGAGEVMRANKAAYWTKVRACAAFATDYVLPAGADTLFPEQPDLSAILTK